MDQSRRKLSYSIIRYSPDEIKGEIINVGLLLHNYEDKSIRYFLLDEKSSKVKSLAENEVELDLYKTTREVIEYYLKNNVKDMSGIVGEKYITSCHNEKFLNDMYEYYKGKIITFSEPNIAYTKNEEKLFDTILKKYVGASNVNLEKTTTMNAKRYMKQIFSENQSLSKRIKSDVVIYPIKELKDLEVKIDFTFKSEKVNYMQAIPKITKSNKNSDWFSKIQLLLDTDIEKVAQIHLLYKNSDFVSDRATYNLLKYLKNKYENIDIHDIDKENEVNILCDYIEKKGQILEQEVV